MADREQLARIGAREAGLRRLKTLRRATAVGATVLAGLIALFAAATAPAKKVVRSLPTTRVVRPAATRRTSTTRTSRPARHATTTTQPAVQAPVQVSGPPVTVSGGS